MAFKKKNTGDHVTREQMTTPMNFAEVCMELSSSEFAMKMHMELVDATKIILNEKHSFDMTDINNVLAKYAGKFSWAIVQAELIKEKASILEDNYEDWFSQRYVEASQTFAEKKPTIDMIKSKVVAMFGEELKKKREQLINLKTKANIAAGIVKVWANEINALQSLSKNINAEIEVAKRGLEA